MAWVPGVAMRAPLCLPTSSPPRLALSCTAMPRSSPNSVHCLHWGAGGTWSPTISTPPPLFELSPWVRKCQPGTIQGRGPSGRPDHALETIDSHLWETLCASMSRKEVGFFPLALPLSLQPWKGTHHPTWHTHTHWRETWAPDRPQDTLPHGAVPLARLCPPQPLVWAGLCHECFLPGSGVTGEKKSCWGLQGPLGFPWGLACRTGEPSMPAGGQEVPLLGLAPRFS